MKNIQGSQISWLEHIEVALIHFSPNSACSVGVLADLVEDRWSRVTPDSQVLVKKWKNSRFSAHEAENPCKTAGFYDIRAVRRPKTMKTHCFSMFLVRASWP